MLGSHIYYKNPPGKSLVTMTDFSQKYHVFTMRLPCTVVDTIAIQRVTPNMFWSRTLG